MKDRKKHNKRKGHLGTLRGREFFANTPHIAASRVARLQDRE